MKIGAKGRVALAGCLGLGALAILVPVGEAAPPYSRQSGFSSTEYHEEHWGDWSVTHYGDYDTSFEAGGFSTRLDEYSYSN